MGGVPDERTARGLGALIGADLALLAADDREIVAVVEDCLERAPRTEVRELAERMRTTGATWGYHPPSPLARRISRRVVGHLLREGSGLDGRETLDHVRSLGKGAPGVVMMGNHLSFVDVNALDCLLAGAGHDDVAGRITALVGPKVFSDPLRRLASLCFGTVKMPQSPSRASGEARMSAREVARLAAPSLEAARERLRRGDHLVVFPEGARSRSGELQRLLPAASRYLDLAESVVVPFAMAGCERLLPIGESGLRRAKVRARLGPAVVGSRLLERSGRRRALAMHAIGFLIADLQAPARRGAYARVEGELCAAREIADKLVWSAAAE